MAESLTQRTKRFASKYFSNQDTFTNEIDEINFKLSEKQDHFKANIWNDSYKRLLTISQAMLDEVQLPSEQLSVIAPPIVKVFISAETKKKKINAILFLIITSITLWSFNYILNWNWLIYHPKKVSIYLSLQVAIIFISTLFLTNNKQIRLVEWLSISVSITLAVISLLN